MRSAARRAAALALAVLVGGSAFVRAAAPVDATATLAGRYDNHAQAAGAAADAMPQVAVAIEPTAQVGWSLWRVHLGVGADAVEETWAMQARTEYDGSTALIPHYRLKPGGPADAARFDANDWLSLEACALRGEFSATRIRAMSEGAPCAVVTMNIGPRRALLPVGLDRAGDELHVDLNYRGARTRIDARRTR